jgi:uncharacterized membrane protein
MNKTIAPTSTPTAGKPLRIGLWAAQSIAAMIFIAAGFTKLTTPIPELVAMIPWTGEFTETFVRVIGLIDLAGGLGLLLPSVTRVQPRLTVLAALGCVALQGIAFGFHVSRGEFDVLPLNVVLLSLSAFVLWGRGKRLPISPRN